MFSGLAAFSFIDAIVSPLFGWSWIPSYKMSLSSGLILAAVGITSYPKTRIYAFAIWVVVGVGLALLYPRWFIDLWIPGFERPFEAMKQVPWLIALAMFGMGATLTIEDFLRIFKMPKGVIVGFVLQFSVMPLLGWSIAHGLMLEPQLATGVLLVGCCPGGVASNVVTYLARGNVALSVTMTACTTLAAPLVTPSLMYLLAGQDVPVPFWGMTRSILYTVVAPVVGGILFNQLIERIKLRSKELEGALAVISICAICLICAIIAANSQESIRSLGAILLIAVLLHNLIGYLLGYYGARLAGLHETEARTIAIEVGLQNGGMAANLAASVLKSAPAAIAPAIFAAVMSITGSILATWWRQHPPKTESALAATDTDR